jgi:fatty acid desaturase
MEDNPNLIESLLERATDYGKTSYELVKLKVLDKATEASSRVIFKSVVLSLFITFLLFVNLGLALWLGEILGKLYWGFLVVAAFYGFVGIVFHFLMHKWFKNLISNYIIKQVFK